MVLTTDEESVPPLRHEAMGTSLRNLMLHALKNGGDSSAVVVEHFGDILYQLGDIETAISQWKIANKLGKASKFLPQKIEEGTLYE